MKKLFIILLLFWFLVQNTSSHYEHGVTKQEDINIVNNINDIFVSKIEKWESAKKLLKQIKKYKTTAKKKHLENSYEIISFYQSRNFKILNVLEKRLTQFIAQQAPFILKVFQDWKELKIIDGVVSLKRKEFDLVFETDIDTYIMVNASFEDYLYKNAISQKTLHLNEWKYPFVSWKGYADTPFNFNNRIIIGNGFNYWFRDRYNKTEIKPQRLIWTRTIGKVLISDYPLPVVEKNISEIDYLNLVFLLSINKSNYDIVELQRKALKIKFEN